MRGSGQAGERDEAEELRNLLRSADQQSRARHNITTNNSNNNNYNNSNSNSNTGLSYVPASASASASGTSSNIDRQMSELASLLGSIEGGIGGMRSSASAPAGAAASTASLPIPPSASASSAYSGNNNYYNNSSSAGGSMGSMAYSSSYASSGYQPTISSQQYQQQQQGMSAAELRDKDLRNMPGSGTSGSSLTGIAALGSLGNTAYGSTYRRTEFSDYESDRNAPRRSQEFPSSTHDDLPFDDFTSDGSSTDFRTKVAPSDAVDYTVVRFHRDYSIRGRLGKYLTTILDESSPPQGTENILNAPPQSQSAAGVKNAVNAAKTSLLGVDGQGIGEDIDCLNFVSVDTKEIDGPIKYGQVIAIKSPSSKERLLGLRDGNKLGFWRHVIGQGEKWQILKANTGYSSLNGPSHYLGTEDISSRGKFVRVGDTILLQTFKSDHFLSLHEGSSLEPKLIYKERTGLGSELWQIEVFGSVPLPSWCQNRPYLSGKYLTIPPNQRTPAPEVEARAFPRSIVPNSATAAMPHSNLHPLNEFSLNEQHYVFMRELLLVLSGVEGNYIRVAAAIPANIRSTTSRGGGGGAADPLPLPKIIEIKLVVDVDAADKSSATQVSQLLAICENIIKIRDFLKQHSRYEYGFISHALCSAIKVIIRDFDILVCQLEYLLNTERLSLQKMVFLLQPSKLTLQVLEKLTMSAREMTGGQLLNSLYVGSLEQGDQRAKEIYEHLLKKASEPFLKMLSLWIFRGELHDPYEEFMIAEDASISKEALQEDFNAQYWDNRYSLNNKHVPKLLANHAMKALTAGKYLNVVRDCLGDYAIVVNTLKIDRSKDGSSSAQGSTPAIADVNNGDGGVRVSSAVNKGPDLELKSDQKQFADIVLPKEQLLVLDLDRSDSTLTKAIDEAYQFSSQALLKLLESGHGLHTHLQSLSRFFLLEHGDFFIQFMDTAEEELRREVKDITLSRVSNLLQLAVQSSTLATDPHREDLHCALASHNLIQHLHLIQMAGESNSYADAYSTLSSQGLKGIEAFTLDYKVAWPASIVLSRRAITKYQLLSRLLYFSKHVERRLLCAWMCHQSAKQYNLLHYGGSAFFSTSYTLRHRMLHFIQNFVYYITLEVIHPRSHELQTEMMNALDMDQVLDMHEKFLDTCLKECLLASQDLLKILTKIMTTCLLFADHMTKFLEDCLQVSTESAANTPLHAKPPKKSTAEQQPSPNAKSNVTPKEAERFKAAAKHRRDKIFAISETLQSETSHDSFGRILNKFGKTFDEQLKEFLDNLWTNSYRHHAQLANLCVRLDYNGFYSNQFASQSL